MLAAELKKILWVSDVAPPLTLDACIAITSAERGSCDRVGGALEAFELESLMTRFATVGPDEWGLVGWTPPSLESTRRIFLDDYLVSVDLKPGWFQHRYGFVEAH
jgi:hypothetical protein